MKSKRILVNVDLVEDVLHSNSISINALSFFFKVKLIFSNSTIYKANTSSRKIAEVVGCSHTVIKSYLNELEKFGLIRIIKGNITFVSLKHTEYKKRKHNQVVITVYSNESISRFASRLKAAMVKKMMLNQIFTKDLKADVNNTKKRLSADRLRQKRKYIDSLPSAKQKSYNADLNISNYTLAKRLNCSIQQISVLKKQWAELNIMLFERVWKPLGKVNPKFFSLYRNSNKYAYVNKHGYAYELQYSRVKFLGVEAIN